MSDAENQNINSEETSANEPELAKAESVDLDDSATETADIDTNTENNSNPELEAAQLEISKLKDAFLRAKAEEDNVRRRAEKEVANSRKFAIEGFAKEMLNVFDSLKLATQNKPAEDADETIKSIYEGSTITLNQLSSAFIKFSVKEITPEAGDKLDPNLHQAMSMVESEDVESGHIITVIQSGFELHDRLLRPAMVVVAK
ncbi:MAG: nucleotide exchange factor GrpE [Gammaproteobacteria bacterium]|nr:nucleotide exchange factor GrpE [Gammaproteobacteria bacterium]